MRVATRIQNFASKLKMFSATVLAICGCARGGAKCDDHTVTEEVEHAWPAQAVAGSRECVKAN